MNLSEKPITIFWDIDGTLLTTKRAGIIAFERAVKDIFNCSVNLSHLKTTGLVDFEVAEQIVTNYLRKPFKEEELWKLLRAYESHLPSCLPLKKGHVTVGLTEILERLMQEKNIENYLLTGNTRQGAHAKLHHYKLKKYFPLDGFFCENRESRIEIGLRAQRQIQKTFTQENMGRNSTFLIGDTPSDISCGKAIRAKTIAICSNYSKGELTPYKPWRIIESFPSPGDFVEILCSK